MRERHALGLAGRAGRILDECEVVRMCLLRLARLAGDVEPAGKHRARAQTGPSIQTLGAAESLEPLQ